MSAGLPSPNPAVRQRLVVSRLVPVDHPAFPGHFPGQPLLPGVLLLSEVMEAAMTDPALARRLAAGTSLQNAKFLSPVLPGARIELALEWDDAGLHFEVTRDGVAASRGQLAWRTAA
jgi:3-hydroxymyristoyl/3-hydroxydecanoyl-(acyl carrier protein) dehydratase